MRAPKRKKRKKQRSQLVRRSATVTPGQCGTQVMRGTTAAPHLGIDLDRREAEDVKRLNGRWRRLGFCVVGTTRGKVLSMTTLAVVIMNIGAFALMATTPIYAVEDGVYDPASYLQCLWFAWGCFFDPGTHTMLHPEEHTSVKTIATVFSITGFMFNCVRLPSNNNPKPELNFLFLTRRLRRSLRSPNRWCWALPLTPRATSWTLMRPSTPTWSAAATVRLRLYPPPEIDLP